MEDRKEAWWNVGTMEWLKNRRKCYSSLGYLGCLGLL